MVNKKDLPEYVKRVVVDKAATRGDLVRAAELAADAGFPQLAAALATRASTIGEDVKAIPSPWKDVPDSSWTRFIRIMSKGHSPSEISPKGFFGMFQLSVRRLCDLGAMTAPKSRNVQSEGGQVVRVWAGNWVVPRERFLSDPALQYKLFLRSMELYRNVIAEKYKQVVGLEIVPGKVATLSGLLAVAHAAGSEGLRKWLVDGEIRKRFPWVTAAYDAANGVF
jgi:hypothetical protein